MQIAFYSSVIAIAVYVVVSLLTIREDYNMDRLLHRGEYADIVEKVDEVTEPVSPVVKKIVWGRIIGIDKDFSLGDKWVAFSLFAWSMFWFTVFIIGTVWNMVSPWSTEAWSRYWHVAGIGVPIFLSVVTAVWFTWGGVRDIRLLFQRLRVQKAN